MPKSASKPEIKVTVHIVPGRSTPAQRQSYKRFWQQLAARVRDEVKASENQK